MCEKKILLIDDDRASKFFAKITLLEENIECIIDEVANGKEAIDLLMTGYTPHIILLDVNMPVMDGYEFLLEYKKLQLHKRATEIYVLTTSDLELDYRRLTSVGIAKAIFEKPFSKRHLFQLGVGANKQEENI